MLEFAYRGFNEEGEYIIKAITAANPEQASLKIQQLNHHIIMLYVLRKKPKPHYVPLLDSANTIPPPHLTSKMLEDIIGDVPKNLPFIIKNGTVEGKSTLFSTSVKTLSLLEALVPYIRAHVFLEGLEDLSYDHDEEEDEEGDETIFSSLTLVDLSKDFMPEKRLEKILDPMDADIYSVVPYKLERGTILILPNKPEFADAEEQELLEQATGYKVEFVRCSANLTEHKKIVTEILKVYNRKKYEEIEQEEEEEQEFREMFGEDYDKEEWEGVERGLPLIPECYTEEFAYTRIGHFVQEAAPLLVAPKETIFLGAKLIWDDVGYHKYQGVRIKAIDYEKHIVEFFDGKKFVRDKDEDEEDAYCRETDIMIFAATLGIDPATIAPARGAFDMLSEGRTYKISGETSLSKYGEQIEVYWH